MLASLKLVDLVKSNAAEIAGLWVKDVEKNKRTPHYHNFSREKLIPIAEEFYRQLANLVISANTYEETQKYFHDYAENAYNNGIPVHEAIYAVVLMRRHMWLFAEFQDVFSTNVEHQQAIDSIIRTILVMDYAFFKIAQYYRELLENETQKNAATGR